MSIDTSHEQIRPSAAYLLDEGKLLFGTGRPPN